MGGDRRVQLHAGARQQQRPVEPVVRERLGAEPLRVRDQRRVARLPALRDRDDARHDGDGEHRGGTGQQHPQPAVRAPLAAGLELGRRPARGDEVALDVVELVPVRIDPLERGREPRAAIELARVAARRVPVACGVGQVAVQPATLRVLLEPAAKARPLAQQRLVRDLHLVLADRDQALARQHVQDGSGVAELPDRHPRADAAVAREPQHDPPCLLALAGVEPLIRGFGEPRDRAADAAAPLVGGQVQALAVALLPELEQGRGQQRQRAGLPLDVGDQRVGQLRLDHEPGVTSRQLDRPAQLVPAHRPDQHVVGAEHPRQLRIRRAVPVEVRPDRDDHERLAVRVACARDDRLGEGRPLAGIAAGREELLELVDGEYPAAPRGQLDGGPLERGQRVLAGPDQRERPARARGQDPLDQRGQQPGAHGGRLAAARRPDDAHQPRPGHPRDHVGHEPLATEEDGRVLDVERGEPLERAAGKPPVRGGEGRPFAGSLELDDPGRKVVLGQPPFRASGGGAGRRIADAPHRLRARPLRRGLLQQAGDAAALGDDPVERHVAVVASAGVEACQRSRGIRLQRAERERLAGRDPVRLRGGGQ